VANQVQQCRVDLGGIDAIDEVGDKACAPAGRGQRGSDGMMRTHGATMRSAGHGQTKRRRPGCGTRQRNRESKRQDGGLGMTFVVVHGASILVRFHPGLVGAGRRRQCGRRKIIWRRGTAHFVQSCALDSAQTAVHAIGTPPHRRARSHRRAWSLPETEEDLP
jgi:hypothetical protein